jgi:multiple sugar transport system permease protein
MQTDTTQPDTLVARPQRPRRGGIERREERLAWMALAPVVLALVAMAVYPLVDTFWLSFQSSSGGGVLGNYDHLLHDVQFWGAFKFSILYSVVTVIGQMIVGTALALLANGRFRGRWLVRAAILFPWAIPTATNSVIWAYMFNDQYGLINSLLEHLGLMSPASPMVWLASSRSATLLIYALAIWKANSLVALLVLAGLQTISEDIYEAARVDGADRWKAFWHMTLPLLRPTLAVALTLRVIESLQAFDLISAFTNGGPGNATQNLGLYIYLQLQEFNNLSYGSTIAVVVMVSTLVLVAFYLRELFRPSYT